MLNLGGWHDVAPSQASKLSLREATMAVIKPQGAVARRGCRATAPSRLRSFTLNGRPIYPACFRFTLNGRRELGTADPID